MNTGMEKRLYCLGIKPIYVEPAVNGRQWQLHPMPSMCLSDFSLEMIELITSLKDQSLRKIKFISDEEKKFVSYLLYNNLL